MGGGRSIFIMIFLINLNRIGHLTLKKDDNPIKAVKNFAKIWGISKDDISDLIARVNDEMQKYFLTFYNLNL